MSIDCTIIEAIPAHIRALAPRLRQGDALEVAAFGLTPQQALWRSWKQAPYRKTILINDEPAAMFGCGGSLLGRTGRPWLLTTAVVERRPLALIKLGKQAIAEMLAIHPHLVNYVHARYDKAIGLLRLFGFTLGEPEPMGPLGEMFRKFEMRA